MKLKPEDILKFEAIGEPQYSPDGNSFIFMRRITQENEVRNAIFCYKDGEETQLTEYERNASHPRISPCGNFLAFIAKHEDNKAIYIVDYDGNNERVLDFEQNITPPFTWSPQGNKILFRTSVSNDDKVAYKGHPINQKHTKETKVKVIKDISFRFDSIGYFDKYISQIFMVEIIDGNFCSVKQLTKTEMDITELTLSADGDKTYFVANPNERALEIVKSNIYSLDSDGNIELCLIGEGYISNLQCSPCNKYLSFTAMDYSDLENRKNYFSCLYIYEIGQEKHLHETRNISRSLDRMVCVCPSSQERYISTTPMYSWAEDSSALYVIYGNKGSSSLARLSLDGNIEVIWEDAMRSISSFTKNEETFIMQIGSIEHPENFYQLDSSEKLLIESNAWLKEYSLGKSHRFTYMGSDYEEIDGWCIVPTSESVKPYKSVLFIHGGPHGVYGSSFMFQTQVLSSNGYLTYFVNPRGSATYGFDFASKVYGDWGGGDFRDIMAGVDYLIAKGIIDKDHLGITGWSYGGYMTSWTISQTDRFKAAIAGASITNRHSFFGTSDIGFTFGFYHFEGTPWDNAQRLIERSPLNFADRIRTPILFVHGEKDLRCPVAQSEELFSALKFLDKEAVLVTYPKEYHGFKKPYHLVDRYERTLAWFNYYLK